MIAVLDRGLDIPCTANTQCSFVVDVNVMIMLELILDAAVTFVRALHMNLLYHLGNGHILCRSSTPLAGCPLIVRGSGIFAVFRRLLQQHFRV